MKLDRNSGLDNKYAVVKRRNLRALTGDQRRMAEDALNTLANLGLVDNGLVNSPSEFFVLYLKDRYAEEALRAYAGAVFNDPRGDSEYANEIVELACRAGTASHFCKRPD